MTTTPGTTCAQCGGTMEPSFLADRREGSGPGQAFWVQGVPEPRTVLGMNAGPRTSDRPRDDVTTYRCARCGLLKSTRVPEDRQGRDF